MWGFAFVSARDYTIRQKIANTNIEHPERVKGEHKDEDIQKHSIPYSNTERIHFCRGTGQSADHTKDQVRSHTKF